MEENKRLNILVKVWSTESACMTAFKPTLIRRRRGARRLDLGGAGQREPLRASADIVTCDNPLWADKVREVSQGTVR